ncbi:MAG: beta-lactamase family protein [Clostridia bacterium]|nr:beta-lactamase family protein [Clostridia bacterium]
METELQYAIQEIFKQAVEEQEVAGANALVLHHGKEIAYTEVGWADKANDRPVRRSDIFRIFSMTKPITGAAVMLLMERGKIDLAEPVSKYLSGFRAQMVQEGDNLAPVWREVRIHDLLSMTSGISYPGGSRDVEKLFRAVEENMQGNKPYTTQDIANALGKCPLLFQPGTNWDYGASADVLGAVVELVSGMTFGEFLRKNLFEPLDMQDTAFYVPAEKQARLPKVYQPTENGLEEFPGAHLGICFDMPQPPAFESGGAGLASTIDDYAKFAKMLMNHGEAHGQQIMRPSTVRYFTSCTLTEEQQRGMNWVHMGGYSYGNLMRVMTRPGEAVIMTAKGEYGWDGYLGTYFANDPKNELTLLMMTQRTGGGDLTIARKMCNAVYARLESLQRGGKAGF